MDDAMRLLDQGMFRHAADAELSFELEIRFILLSFDLPGSNCFRPKTSLLIICP